MLKFEDKKITLKEVHRVVCDKTNLGLSEIFFDTRKRHIVEYRHLFCYISKTHTKETLENIGRYIGIYRRRNYDHASVLHGYKKIRDIMSYDRSMRILVNNIIYELTIKNPKMNKLVVSGFDGVASCIANTVNEFENAQKSPLSS